MSIHFISGKPGGGKSLYGTKLCFEELRFGNRPIVTNLALKIGELNQYYQKHYDDPENLFRFKLPWFLSWLAWSLPDWLAFRVLPIAPELIEEKIRTPKMDDICRRVRIISDDEMAVFFTKRPDNEVEHVTNADWKSGKRPDYSVVKDAGVFFCLDEVHIAFNSRAWAETGAEVLFYLSQHRKLGDDVICITQSVGNVDKQFRSVAQDFTYIRNLGKEKAGIFRMPMRFVRKTYSQPPTGDMSQPQDTAIFSLDVHGLARCYDTAKGVGIHGRSGADKRERKKGFHWAWFVVGLPILILAFVHWFPKMAVGFLNKPTHEKLKTMTATNPPALLPSVSLPARPGIVSSNQFHPPVPVQAPAPLDPSPPVEMAGYIQSNGKFIVYLTDGTTYQSGDGELMQLGKKFCIIGTNRFKLHVDDPRLRQAANQSFSQSWTASPAPNEIQPFYRPLRSPFPSVQIIPFGNRNQPTPLPEDSLPTDTFQASTDRGFSR